MKREVLLTLLSTAGYHDDHAAYTRLVIENRISQTRARLAFKSGAQAKRAGVRCDCSECKVAARTAPAEPSSPRTRTKVLPGGYMVAGPQAAPADASEVKEILRANPAPEVRGQITHVLVSGIVSE